MRYLSLLVIPVIILSGCTWGTSTQTPTSPNQNPYPSKPLGATGDIVAPTEAKGENYTVSGTEPFWSVQLTPSTATLERPGNPDPVKTNYTVTQEDKGSIVTIRDIKGEFFVTLTKGSCSDGMSEKKYPYNASVFVGAETLTGCAMKN